WSITVSVVSVSLQETVEAVIGGSVLLPCSSTEHGHKLQDTNVHWRANGSKIVYDIVKGEETVSDQDQQYKNRTETFPEEYERGNFSIKLTDLTHTDAGKYTCQITPSNEQETVQLIINELFAESTAEKRSISTEQENQGETEPDSVETSSPWLWVGIALVIIVTVIVIGFIVAWWKRKNSSSRRTDRHDKSSTRKTRENKYCDNDTFINSPASDRVLRPRPRP
ncbi:hypothetical protein PO909_027087, partial [Leuciscus waleckii]